MNPDNTEVPIIATMFSRNDKFIFASTNASVYASEDAGKTWKSIGPSPDGKPLWMMSIFAKGSYVFTSMAGRGVFRSSDSGITWSYLGDPAAFTKYMD